jgi:hypothetical protein
MKKFLLATAALVALAGSALACGPAPFCSDPPELRKLCREPFQTSGWDIHDMYLMKMACRSVGMTFKIDSGFLGFLGELPPHGEYEQFPNNQRSMILAKEAKTIQYTYGLCTAIEGTVQIDDEAHTSSVDVMCPIDSAHEGYTKTHITFHVERTEGGDIYVTTVSKWHEYTTIETWKWDGILTSTTCVSINWLD